MARISRKELKTDKFALEVENTFTFFEDHQKEILRYGAIAVGVALLVTGILMYQRRQHSAREAALAKAIQVQEANVTTAAAPGTLAFPTQEAKDAAAIKVFTDLRNQYPGSTEAEIAGYYLGAIQADQGKLAEAEKNFQEVAQKGDARYSSLAKLSLSQIYFTDGRMDQAEKVLRDLMAHPTIFVSKDQAAIALARGIMLKKPAEARKLLDPIKTEPGSAGEVALTLYGEIPPQ
ncbi:MAG TPA: tetratricopeptide repeat protein [Bryobacteraceae bacterium]|nr:tetratricopeptide repeat protein [Bryobacteraceae bacterium]